MVGMVTSNDQQIVVSLGRGVYSGVLSSDWLVEVQEASWRVVCYWAMA